MSADADAAVRAALATLEAEGFPPDRVVLGVTAADPLPDGTGTPYATHVGGSHDGKIAGLLDLVATDLAREASQAAVSLFRHETCPACGSPRWAFWRARRRARPGENPGVYVDMWDECLDCGHKGPTR